MNPLLALNWIDVRMMSIDSGGTDMTILRSDSQVQTFHFPSTDELDAALIEWLSEGDHDPRTSKKHH
ncbi:MAG TPA: hypothetical protein VF773_17750 [Verrucomicrobiae bacterium]